MSLNIKQMPRQRLIAWTILIALFVYSLVILYLSSSTSDLGDGVTHYLIARYSWVHYQFMVDEWGKPLFTLLASPFAQFGIKGVAFFNTLCGLTASYYAYRIAEKLNTPFPYLAIIFTFSAPIYFTVVNSALTEPMFSLMLVLSIWLIMNERYYASAILLSFFPFVRADYIYVWPFFAFYFVLKRKYLANLLFPVGSIVITLMGYFYYKDFLWIINQNPYKLGAITPGDLHGDIFCYIGEGVNITGRALEVLVVIGIVWYAGGRYLKKYSKAPVENHFFMEELILVFGCFLGILGGQTIVWTLGIPTLGPMRYMVPLIPQAAIIALRGLQLITILFDSIKMHWANWVIATYFAIAVLYSPYKLWYKVPFQLGDQEVQIKKATDWLKQNSYMQNKIYYEAPYFAIEFEMDPLETIKHGSLGNLDTSRPDLNIPQGSVIVWENHYGIGRIPLDTLIKNPDLTLLNEFDTDGKDKALKGIGYSVWVFQRK